MNELIAYLNSIRPLSPPLAERIKSLFKLRRLVKAAFLLREGDPDLLVVFVVKGILRYFEIKDNSDISKSFLQRHDIIINGIGLERSSPATGFLQALAADTVVMTCPKKEFDRLYADFPEFEHHGRILNEQSYHRLYSMLDNIRMHSAQERYQFLQAEFPQLILSVPNKYLASFLGISEITLSRIRSIR